MTNRDILAIGTSAGGVDALLSLARSFAPDFPAAVLVTLHIAPHFRSSFDNVLSNAGPLPAKFATDGERAARGTIYLAPPDRHLLMTADNRLRLGTGPRENNSRPAIDPMLRSVAACCGSRAVGAVLTGTLGDGASGLFSIATCGGITVVQDPQDAAYPEMPINALRRLQPEHVVPLADMPALFDRLVQEPAGPPEPAPIETVMEVNVAKGGHIPMHEMDRIGRRSVFTCPDCNGVMWEIEEGNLRRYRCHVGHAYTAELMSLAFDESLRRALAIALRSLEERAALARKLQADAEGRQQRHAAATWSERAAEFQRELDVIRQVVGRMDEIAARQPQQHRN